MMRRMHPIKICWIVHCVIKYVENSAPRLGITLPPLSRKPYVGIFFLSEKIDRLVVRYAIARKRTEVAINKPRFPTIEAISAVDAWMMIARYGVLYFE